MPHDPMLESGLAILLAAVSIVSLAPLLRTSPVVGYLIAGALLGPQALAVVSEPDSIALLAELGVVFLLFTIGLELSLERLRSLGAPVLWFGVLQIAASGLAIALVVRLLGEPWPAAILLGGALALSSTAFVLQLLKERGETAARFARVCLAVLVLQDLAVVPLLAAIAPLGGEDIVLAELATSLLRALLAVGLMLLAGRYLLRPLFRLVTRGGHHELVVATALLVVLGAAYGMTLAGLSMALGALLAGVMLAGTEYRHEVEADLRGFKGLLLGLFFIFVGMTADLRAIAAAWPVVVGGALALMLGKSLLMAGLARLLRLPLGTGLRVGGYLAQGGEFAFVLLTQAVLEGVVTPGAASITLAIVVLSLALTPPFSLLARRLAERLERRSQTPASPAALQAASEGLEGHLLIAGFGRVGETVARMAARRGIPVLAIDRDPARVAAGRHRDLPLFFGDASRIELLDAAGAARARALIVTMDNADAALACVAAVRHRYATLPVIARARDPVQARRLLALGATEAVPEAVEGSLRLGAATLLALGEAAGEIEALLAELRDEGYAELAPPKEARGQD